MKIREEIERLKLEVNTASFRPVDREHAQTVNEVIEEVLSILDRWELVAEFPLDIDLRTTKHLAGRFMDEETLIDVITDQRKFKLGDRIAIYRRK